MHNDKIEKIIISAINSIKKIQNKETFKNKKFDFLSSGHLDSLQLMHFIITLEKKFKFTFTIKEKESKNFRFIDGLIKIIKKKI